MTSRFSHFKFSIFVFTLFVWTTTGFGQAPKLLKESSEPASFVAVSPDGKIIAYITNDHMVNLWNVKSGKVTKKITKTSTIFPQDRYSCLAFTPDGKRLAGICLSRSVQRPKNESDQFTVRVESAIKIWDAETGNLIRTLYKMTFYVSDNNTAEDEIISLAYSPDGKKIALGCMYSSVKLVDVKSGELLKTLDEAHKCVYSVSFSHDGRLLSACSSNKTIVWDLKGGKQILSHKSNEDGPCLFAFSPTGNIFVIADSDGLHAYEADSQNETQLIKNQIDHYYGCLSFSSDGKKMISGKITGFDADDFGVITLWDVNSGNITQSSTIRVPFRGTSAILFPDGKTLMSSASRFSPIPLKFKLWDLLPIKIVKNPNRSSRQ